MFLVTGCDVTYNLTIEDENTFDENIVLSFSKSTTSYNDISFYPDNKIPVYPTEKNEKFYNSKIVENTNSAYTNFNRNNSKTILGGLVGQIKGQSTIDTTYANYVITLDSIINVGSFVGAVDTDSNVTISNSYLTQGVGVVINGEYNTPGLIGNLSDEVELDNVMLNNVFMFKKQGASPGNPSYQAIVYENNNEKQRN